MGPAATDGPRAVPRHDHETRRRAARAVTRAWIGSPYHLLAAGPAVLLAGYILIIGWRGYRTGIGFEWLLALLVPLLVFLVLAALPPWLVGRSASSSRGLFYYDSGTARAAIALKPDTARRHLPGDQHAHSLGAWPQNTHTGLDLITWVTDHVTDQGGRLTVTARPRLAAVYRTHAMHDDGRVALIFRRVVATPTPPAGPDRSAPQRPRPR